MPLRDDGRCPAGVEGCTRESFVNDAHLKPEPEEVMDHRLGDVEKQWRDAEVVTAQ